MHRTILGAGLAILLAAPSLAGQQAPADPPTHVYMAFYKINYGDFEAWSNAYREATVPVLEELRDEGLIEGWSAWQHSVGGEYNWRLAIRTYGWPQLGDFWEQYLGRLQERFPEIWDRSLEMVEAHYDEVWDIEDVHMTDDTGAQYFLDSSFQLSFGDMEEWNRIWNETAAPALDQAMQDGLLSGWVRLSHNTGGRHNWKVLYFFDEWDDMDDMFEQLESGMMGDPEAMQRVFNMIISHDDIIWMAMPEPEM